jgi:RNA polymerase sigma-70 factor, ECF subfamily
MTSDADLIRMAQRGDNVAFTELVHRHDRAVFALIARSVDNAEDAKDIYQEVFLRVYRGLKAFQFRSEFSTWVHRIAVNACIDSVKRTRRSVSAYADPIGVPDPSNRTQGFEPASDERDPDQRVIDGETAARITHAMQLLSPRQRMVFVLRHYEGRSLKEIAGTLECTTGTVKRYLFEATQNMRLALRALLQSDSL